MGDVGYFDAEGNLWFCGRANHVVHTAEGPLYPDQVEGVFNAHACVARSALIGYPVDSREQFAAVVVQTQGGIGVPPMSRDEVARELLELAAKRVVFDDNFPLDVRHNAKIDRIALARRHALPVGGKGGVA
jgi:acyl-coenzyme A synthetase/AMP-(fatty) acid ligase